MVVAAYGGGAYNVLPISPYGELGPVTQIIKEIGSSIHPLKQRTAHPHSLVFHPTGQFVISTDLGTDTINVFNFVSGRLTRLHQIRTPAGSGPAQLTINEAGTLVSVTHQITPFVASYRFHPDTGDMARLTTVKLSC
jgi:6-phosphogluconolactonase (cycloisomerase 2 family)